MLYRCRPVMQAFGFVTLANDSILVTLWREYSCHPGITIGTICARKAFLFQVVRLLRFSNAYTAVTRSLELLPLEWVVFLKMWLPLSLWLPRETTVMQTCLISFEHIWGSYLGSFASFSSWAFLNTIWFIFFQRSSHILEVTVDSIPKSIANFSALAF